MTQTVSSEARLRWACRRGMLELDLILLTFFEAEFARMTLAEQKDFELFLSEQDQDLYAWLLNFQPCPEPRYQSLLLNIRAYVEHHYST